MPRKLTRPLAGLPIFIAALAPLPAHAAPALDGASLAWPWAIPFVGILLTIACGPLFFKHVWHLHYGKFAFAWALLALVPMALIYGLGAAWAAFVHAVVAEYMSFIILLFALYVTAGGVLVTGTIRGTPANNAAVLGFGTAIASIVGTTGAAMILIRPLLRANAHRPYNVHVVVFFIILVANIGGALSPLGDPPLFVGFLRGVDFFWPLKALWSASLFLAVLLLAGFFALDTWLSRQEHPVLKPANDGPPIGLRGGINLLLIAGIIVAILASAAWKPGINFDLWGTTLPLQSLVRDLVLVAIALISLWITPDEHRKANGYSWEPIREVAILFAGIFTTIIPVLAMLQAGKAGLFAPLIDVVARPDGTPANVAYFWMTGLLSAFLDNAPTYVVFFELAGGDAQRLMGPLAATLSAISMGAVYMGALTYIGNAPNFMVYAIASERGVAMPSFFGYLAWSSVILLPAFVLVSFLFVR